MDIFTLTFLTSLFISIFSFGLVVTGALSHQFLRKLTLSRLTILLAVNVIVVLINQISVTPESNIRIDLLITSGFFLLQLFSIFWFIVAGRARLSSN